MRLCHISEREPNCDADLRDRFLMLRLLGLDLLVGVDHCRVVPAEFAAQPDPRSVLDCEDCCPVADVPGQGQLLLFRPSQNFACRDTEHMANGFCNGQDRIRIGRHPLHIWAGQEADQVGGQCYHPPDRRRGLQRLRLSHGGCLPGRRLNARHTGPVSPVEIVGKTHGQTLIGMTTAMWLASSASGRRMLGAPASPSSQTTSSVSRLARTSRT